MRGAGLKNKSGSQVYACFSSATSLSNQLGQFHTFKTTTKKPKSGRLHSPALWIYCLVLYFSCFRALGITSSAEHWQMFPWLLHRYCQPDNFCSSYLCREKSSFVTQTCSHHMQKFSCFECVCVCVCVC